MALNIYSPPFQSSSSGEIRGDTQAAGFEDHLVWFACQHEIDVSHDAASGKPSGRRQHGPLVATKRIDRATPLLHDTLTRVGTLDEVQFRFYRPNASGVEEHYFTITLEEATISRIRIEQLNNRYPDHMSLDVFEHVSFAYDKITWEEVISGTMAFDSWRSFRRRGG